MFHHVKLWIAVAGILILVGGLLFTFALSKSNWDFANLSTAQLELNTYNITEHFSNISIDAGNSDIIFIPSPTDMCTVECYEGATAKHTVVVQGNTLSISVEEAKPWRELTFLYTPSPKITVYLPPQEYGALTIQLRTGDVDLSRGFSFGDVEIHGTTGDVSVRSSFLGALKIDVTTGDINVEDVSAKSMELSVTTGNTELAELRCTENISMHTTTGRVHLSHVQCNDLQSRGDSGDILLADVIAEGTINLKRTTGDIEFAACDAPELLVKVTTGDVTGSLLSEKIFVTQTTTGSVDVPGTSTGGKCDISSTTGDIKITIP